MDLSENKIGDDLATNKLETGAVFTLFQNKRIKRPSRAMQLQVFSSFARRVWELCHFDCTQMLHV